MEYKKRSIENKTIIDIQCESGKGIMYSNSSYKQNQVQGNAKYKVTKIVYKAHIVNSNRKNK